MLVVESSMRPFKDDRVSVHPTSAIRPILDAHPICVEACGADGSFIVKREIAKILTKHAETWMHDTLIGPLLTTEEIKTQKDAVSKRMKETGQKIQKLQKAMKAKPDDSDLQAQMDALRDENTALAEQYKSLISTVPSSPAPEPEPASSVDRKRPHSPDLSVKRHRLDVKPPTNITNVPTELLALIARYASESLQQLEQLIVTSKSLDLLTPADIDKMMASVIAAIRVIHSENKNATEELLKIFKAAVLAKSYVVVCAFMTLREIQEYVVSDAFIVPVYWRFVERARQIDNVIRMISQADMALAAVLKISRVFTTMPLNLWEWTKRALEFVENLSDWGHRLGKLLIEAIDGYNEHLIWWLLAIPSVEKRGRMLVHKKYKDLRPNQQTFGMVPEDGRNQRLYIVLDDNLIDRRVPLPTAAERGNMPVVEFLLKQPDLDVNAVNIPLGNDDWDAAEVPRDGYYSALHYAAEHLDVPMINLLLQQPSIDAFLKNDYNITPLWLFLDRAQETLLDNQFSASHQPTKRDYLSIIELFLQKKSGIYDLMIESSSSFEFDKISTFAVLEIWAVFVPEISTLVKTYTKSARFYDFSLERQLGRWDAITKSEFGYHLSRDPVISRFLKAIVDTKEKFAMWWTKADDMELRRSTLSNALPEFALEYKRKST